MKVHPPAGAEIPAGGAGATCWNRIGVQGDGSCPELVQHIHCRNCPVFSAAAAHLLDREIPAGYLAEWTAHHAAPQPPLASDLQSVVIFRLGVEWLALPTRVLDAVIAVRPIHSLPHRRDGVVLGLANVRGELIVCVSLGKVVSAHRSGGSPKASSRPASERLVVLRRGPSRYAASVDELYGTHRFSRAQLVRPPATVAGAPLTYTAMMLPWAGKAVGCLDDELLFHTLDRSLA
jgi:chemotaxis-related protein WspD